MRPSKQAHAKLHLEPDTCCQVVCGMWHTLPSYIRNMTDVDKLHLEFDMCCRVTSGNLTQAAKLRLEMRHALLSYIWELDTRCRVACGIWHTLPDYIWSLTHAANLHPEFDIRSQGTSGI